MAIHVLIGSFSVLCPLRGRYLGAEPSAAGKGDCVASPPCIPEATPATLETPQRQALRQAPAANSPFKQQMAQTGGGLNAWLWAWRYGSRRRGVVSATVSGKN